MMMLLKLNQQLMIPGLADVLQQVADLKDATAAGNVVSSVIVYWLSLAVRVLLAMYWHFRGGRCFLSFSFLSSHL